MVDATTLSPTGPLVGSASGAAQTSTQSRGGIEDSELVPNRFEHELRAALRSGVEHESTATVDLQWLAELPPTQNMWNEGDELVGLWGDMTIARHQLRKVDLPQGDMVIDFVHAINGPVTLVGPMP